MDVREGEEPGEMHIFFAHAALLDFCLLRAVHEPSVPPGALPTMASKNSFAQKVSKQDQRCSAQAEHGDDDGGLPAAPPLTQKPDPSKRAIAPDLVHAAAELKLSDVPSPATFDLFADGPLLKQQAPGVALEVRHLGERLHGQVLLSRILGALCRGPDRVIIELAPIVALRVRHDLADAADVRIHLRADAAGLDEGFGCIALAIGRRHLQLHARRAATKDGHDRVDVRAHPHHAAVPPRATDQGVHFGRSGRWR
mmetsp:Transcript_4757/g.13843  ORF Transcript_4757/g.13843 Transcript_4757/m.13843 type:complete len:254 (+) Transcript_4757:180-941(+)